jgi:uncharacterized membrane protein YdjX (TVP38/TMEM64 family)
VKILTAATPPPGLLPQAEEESASLAAPLVGGGWGSGSAGWLWRPLLLLGGLVAAGLLLRELHADSLDFASAGTASPWGMAGFVALGAAASAAGLPRQAVAYAAGYAFGLWAGMPLALAAQLLGCALDVVWARAVARRWARAWLARHAGGRLRRLDEFLGANPFAATVMLRLLPVGNNLALNLLAGVSSVAALGFLAGSAVGYLPQTLMFVLVGTGVHLDRTAEIGLGAALFAASAAVGLLLLRRFRAAWPASPAAGGGEALNAGGADAQCGAAPPH